MNNNIKILHLEDSLKDSELIRSLIDSGGIGHDYFLAENEEDYLKILEKENIDIILSDYRLPDYNGNEALKVAREKYSYIPFIFLSGTMGEDAAINAMLNGATDYVLKNKLERLVPSIKRALNERELVSRRKLTEEALAISETRYRRLFETAKDGIIILDAKTGMIKDVNPFLIEMLGYSKEQFIEKTIWEIGFFKDRVANRDKFIELQQQEYVRYEDLPIETADGRIINVEFVSNVYLVDHHKVIQCNIRDITERKQAERKQELTTKILSILGSEANWKQSINDILVEIKNYTGMEAIGIRLKENEDYPYYETKGFPEYFIEVENYLCARNEKGEIIYDGKGNPCLECMCGNVISGQTDPSLPYFTEGGSFFSNNTSELLTTTTEKDRPSATRNRCNSEGYESVALIPLYSGKEIIGLLQLNDRRSDMFTLEMIRFFEKTGNTIGIAFNRIRNENKIKENEQNLKKQNADFKILNEEYLIQNEELAKSLYLTQKTNVELISAKAKAEESDTLKSAFLANMSHEIRTPMNAIMGFSGFLLQPELSKEKIEDFVQIINASSLQLLSVISDIIDISKIEAGQITLDIELVNINNLLDELFVTYKKIVELKNLNLSCSKDCPNDVIQVKTDGNRIKQVLCNLLNNAIKFTKEGAIEFGYKIRGNFIEFYVKDTGIGIAPENHALVFQRFRQIEKTDTREYGGNGLGLSISKALIEKLGGVITVNSELGSGSNFTFNIPYTIGTENTVTSVLTAKPDRCNWNEKMILIVEDEVNSHAYIEELFSGKDVKLLHAWDGMQAVEQVKSHSDISLVLMDIKMPVMDGYAATRRIKQIRPKLPVIAQTAFALSHERKQAIDAGCDNYISKPINRNLFMDVISNYLA